MYAAPFLISLFNFVRWTNRMAIPLHRCRDLRSSSSHRRTKENQDLHGPPKNYLQELDEVVRIACLRLVDTCGYEGVRVIIPPGTLSENTWGSWHRKNFRVWGSNFQSMHLLEHDSKINGNVKMWCHPGIGRALSVDSQSVVVAV